MYLFPNYSHKFVSYVQRRLCLNLFYSLFTVLCHYQLQCNWELKNLLFNGHKSMVVYRYNNFKVSKGLYENLGDCEQINI